MSDYAKFKELALAAPTGPWYAPDESAHKGTVFDCDLGSLLCYESIESEQEACVAYVAASNPAVVLGLIAENEKLLKLLTRVVDQHVPLTELERVPGWSRVVKLVDVTAERDALKAENKRLTDVTALQMVRKFVGGMNQSAMDDLVATGIRAQDEELAALKAECEGLRVALTAVFNHVEGNTECLVRDLVNWGTPRVDPNDFYGECEAIKAIALAGLSKGEQS